MKRKRAKCRNIVRQPEYRYINEKNWKRLCLLGLENRSLDDFLNQKFFHIKKYIEFTLWMEEAIKENESKLKMIKELDRYKMVIRAETKKHVNILKKEGVTFICEKCGSDKPEIHHNSYYVFNDITFLCRKCHFKEHKRLKVINRENKKIVNYY